jgi:hypothetical protein
MDVEFPLDGARAPTIAKRHDPQGGDIDPHSLRPWLDALAKPRLAELAIPADQMASGVVDVGVPQFQAAVIQADRVRSLVDKEQTVATAKVWETFTGHELARSQWWPSLGAFSEPGVEPGAFGVDDPGEALSVCRSRNERRDRGIALDGELDGLPPIADLDGYIQVADAQHLGLHGCMLRARFEIGSDDLE